MKLEYFLIIFFLFFSYLLIHGLFNFINRDTLNKNDVRRLKALRFGDKSLDSEDEQLRYLVNKVTDPFMFLIPQTYKRNVPLQKKLELIGWDKYFTSDQFFIILWIFRIIGIALILLRFNVSKVEGIIGFIIFFFAPSFLLNNEYSETKKKIFGGFPSIIKTLSCFLNADLSFVDASKSTLMYTNGIWSRLLEEFINDCEMYSYEVGINNICEKLDIWEITDFFSMIHLGLEKGINLKESFQMQSDRIDALYRQSMISKINKRESLASAISAPLLLGVIVAFGMPMVSELLTFTSMTF